MAGFDDVAVSWRGTEYRVPANKCMGLLAAIEEQLAPGGRGDILGILGQPHKAHLTRIARAYGAALRYAGCMTMQGPEGEKVPKPITDEEVYLSLSREMQVGGVDAVRALQEMAGGLLMLFFPDWAADEALGKQEGEPEQTAEAATPSTPQSTGGE